MNILIDTGPIVALLDKRDTHHNFVDEKMRLLTAPFYTCEAVITESFFLLQHVPQGIARLIEVIEAGKINIPFSYMNHSREVHRLIETYGNIPASFADACLVQMYELQQKARIFTIDSDFTIYRTSKGKPLSLISPS